MKPENRIKTEKKRLQQLLENVPEERKKALERIVENLAWMAAKLDDAREQIGTESVTVPYDNGGGQSGIRENPLYKGYENLWRSYMTGMDRILAVAAEYKAGAQDDSTPKPENGPASPQTVLELIRKKRGIEA